MGKLFDIRRLKPFHRQGAHLQGTAPEDEDKIAELDPNLKPEEHSYVGHYVNYADILLDKDPKNGDQEEAPAEEPPDRNRDAEAVREPPARNVVEMPERVRNREKGDHSENDGKVA